MEKELNKEFETDDLDDFELKETKPNYEVWLLGDDASDVAVDFSYMIDDFDTQTEAKKCFDFFANRKVIDTLLDLNIPAEVAHLYIRVETVAEDENGESTNLDTLYEQEVF